MSNYVDWQRLEQIIVPDEAAQQDIARKYPNEMIRWSILRKRNGRFCPMARGVLKLIVYNERDNAAFKKNLDESKWTTIYE